MQSLSAETAFLHIDHLQDPVCAAAQRLRGRIQRAFIMKYKARPYNLAEAMLSSPRQAALVSMGDMFAGVLQRISVAQGFAGREMNLGGEASMAGAWLTTSHRASPARRLPRATLVGLFVWFRGARRVFSLGSRTVLL